MCGSQTQLIVCKTYLPKKKLNLKIPEIDGVLPGVRVDFLWGNTVMRQTTAGMTVPKGKARELEQ